MLVCLGDQHLTAAQMEPSWQDTILAAHHRYIHICHTLRTVLTFLQNVSYQEHITSEVDVATGHQDGVL